jgi:hypothetical protein
MGPALGTQHGTCPICLKTRIQRVINEREEALSFNGNLREIIGEREEEIARLSEQLHGEKVSTQAKDWNPIETAPQDETPIQGWNGLEMTSIKWDKLMGRWELVCPGEYAEDLTFHPICWMPLPAEPCVEVQP